VVERIGTPTALHLRQKSIPNFLRSPAVGAPHPDSQCLPISELLIISTLAMAELRAEPEAEAAADSKHFDTFGALYTPGRIDHNLINRLAGSILVQQSLIKIDGAHIYKTNLDC